MILVDKYDKQCSIGISNEVSNRGTVTFDLIATNKVVILDVQQIKNLLIHLQVMIKSYEGKSDSKSSP
jgi:hypothetical protein